MYGYPSIHDCVELTSVQSNSESIALFRVIGLNQRFARFIVQRDRVTASQHLQRRERLQTRRERREFRSSTCSNLPHERSKLTVEPDEYRALLCRDKSRISLRESKRELLQTRPIKAEFLSQRLDHSVLQRLQPLVVIRKGFARIFEFAA